MKIDVGKIDAQIRRLEELKRVMADPEMVKLLESAMVNDPIDVSEKQPERAAPPKADAPEEEPTIEVSRRRGWLTDTVTKYAMGMEGEFTAYKLTDLMLASGERFDAENPSYSVNDILRKLVKQGRLRISRQGSGSSPNYFERLTTEGQAQLLKAS